MHLRIVGSVICPFTVGCKSGTELDPIGVHDDRWRLMPRPLIIDSAAAATVLPEVGLTDIRFEKRKHREQENSL